MITKLAELAPQIRARGVSHMFLFGSQARNQARTDSDIDLFCEFENPRFSLFDLLDIKGLIESHTGQVADIMTRGSLHPRLKLDIERSALQVF